ncbi:hypothetical protein BGX34_004913 [Mortierella sp. NVP85]|nr:hypothetical protein BGX34_004913 [Mortierella sp. NVP85]
MTELIRQFSTAVNNLWEGPLYAKLQDHLLTVLLRIHLAPVREQTNMDKKKKFAKTTDTTQTHTTDTTRVSDTTQSATQSITPTLVTQAALPTQSAQIKMSRSVIKWKMRELCDELSDVWQKGTETDKQAARVCGIFKQLLKLKNSTPDLSPQKNQGSSLHPMNLEDDSDDGDPGHSANQGNKANENQHRKEAQDMAANPTDLVTTNDSLTVKGPSAAKESSAANLRGLKAILKMLLESPSINETIDEEWVKRSESAGSDFSTKERNVVAHLANILRPYTPKRRDPLPGTTSTRDPVAHVATRAPFTLIANTVLRATGYNHFCHSVCPEVSAGSLQAIPLGPVGLYEMLCSQDKDRFDVNDADGNPLTNVMTVTSNPQNREAVIGSFFDLSRINAICDAHGLSFSNRLVYVDEFTVRMVGKVLPNGDGRLGFPVTSDYDRRKKEDRKRGRPNPWKEKFLALGMTKAQVEAKAEELSVTKKGLENDVKSLRETVSTSQEQQSQASADVTKRLPGAYDKLRLARVQVRSDMRALVPKEEELREVQRDLYKWNGLLRAATKTSTETSTETSTKTSTKTPSKTPAKLPAKTAPSWTHRTVEDKASQLDISTLIEECGIDRQVAFAGTDYGLHCMSETVVFTQREIETHLNRYHCLKGKSIIEHSMG